MPRPAIAPVEDRRLLAIGLILAALFAFTGIDTCAKWLILEGVPTAEVVFVRYLVNLLLVIALTLPLGEPLVATRNLGALALRGGFLLLSTILNFVALRHLPLTVTSAPMAVKLHMFERATRLCVMSPQITILRPRTEPKVCRRPSAESIDARGEFVHFKWLYEIPRMLEIEHLEEGLHADVGRSHNHGQDRMRGPDGLEQRHAVGVGQAHVEDDDVRGEILEQLERLRPARGERQVID